MFSYIVIISTKMEFLQQQVRMAFDIGEVNIDNVMNILKAYRSNPISWSKYTTFINNSYTRNLVDAGNGKYKILILCWAAGVKSRIHDHSSAQCFVKILKGHLTEKRYEFPNENLREQPLREKSLVTLGIDEITLMNDELGLHCMENQSEKESCVSLHIYFPPFNYCNIYDPLTSARKLSPIVYHSKYGKKFDCRPHNDNYNESYNVEEGDQ